MSAYGPPQTDIPDDLKYGSNRRYDPAEARRRVESMRADLFTAGRPPSYAKLMYDLSDVELLLTEPKPKPPSEWREGDVVAVGRVFYGGKGKPFIAADDFDEDES